MSKSIKCTVEARATTTTTASKPTSKAATSTTATITTTKLAFVGQVRHGVWLRKRRGHVMVEIRYGGRHVRDGEQYNQVTGRYRWWYGAATTTTTAVVWPMMLRRDETTNSIIHSKELVLLVAREWESIYVYVRLAGPVPSILIINW